MTKYKIVKESKALPEGWTLGSVVNQNDDYFYTASTGGYSSPIGIEHLNALLELGVIEEVKEWNPRELEHGDLHWKLVQVRLRDVEAQQFKWLGDELDLIDRELGNCHPTKEAAEAWKSKLLANDK